MATGSLGNIALVKLAEKLRRWWKPRERLPDHPLSEEERLEEEQHADHFWDEAEEIGGPGGRARIHVEREFEPPP